MQSEKDKVTSEDSVIAEELAEEIRTRFDSGDNRLLSIKVCINPQYKKANIYIDYEDLGRSRDTGSEDSAGGFCEEIVVWPHFECLENTDEKWANLSFPSTQMERALALSKKLNKELIILSCSDNLKCYIEDGKARIDKI
jgi:hypothetical protein